MRIAMLVFNLPERGTYWRAYYIAREICRLGHYVTLVATAPKARRSFRITHTIDGRLTLVEAPDLLQGSLRSGWDPWATLLRTAWLSSVSFDLVHAFECRPTVIFPALSIHLQNDTRLVIDWCDWFGHGGSVEERTNPIQRTILRPVETFFETYFRTWADATTVINQTLYQRAVDLGVPPTSITLVPNGCDTAGWQLEIPRLARAALNLPLEAPLVGYVGAIFKRDALLMAQAFNILHLQRPDARLIVMGYCNIAIEQLVYHSHTVIRTGPLDNFTLRRYLRACTLGWLPLCDSGANRGRWPLKLNTYMEAGLPFITTNIGDLGAFVERYPAGIAAMPDPYDMAARTIGLLDDPDHLALLGITGRQLAETDLNWSNVGYIVEKVYCHLLKQR